MNEFLLVLGMTLVTFGVRYPVMALVGKINLPQPVIEALRYVPPVVLASIIMPTILIPDSTLWIAPENIRIIAGVVTALVMWRSKNLLLTIFAGMGLFLVLQTL